MEKQNAVNDEVSKNSSRGETAGRDQCPSEDAIRAWLVANISAVIEIDSQQIDTQKPFEHYGMDSLQAMHLSGELEDWLGHPLSPTVVWDYPTIEALAHHLAEGRK